MGYQDDEFSPDNNPGPRLSVGPFVDPKQLPQLVMAARAAQGNRGAGTSPVSSRGVGVSTGPLVDPQRLAQLLMTIRAAQRGGQGASAAQPAAPAQSLPASVLGPTDPFAAGAGSGIPTPLPNANPDMTLAIQRLPNPNPAKAAVIQNLRQALANRRQGAGARSTTGAATGQAGAKRPQIPLGAPPTGLPTTHKPTPLESIQGIVADVAGSKNESTDYLVAKSKGHYKAGTDKCNELVADTIEESGLPRPQVHYTNEGGVKGAIKSSFSRDPDANEWANPKVKIPGWSEPRPVSEARPGDVIAQQHGTWGHAGVVVSWRGQLLTISVNTADKIPGLVNRNDWGFRRRGLNGEKPTDPEPIVRHYIGK